ncbi:hypothetical protein [Sphingobium sp. YR768]|uniref:hypothetical protein n=1 Tax=Sphingobium sp. YR768 TaxID=1884365 RepID=UPI00115F98E5|nr:hypothetical protein [Sphingobium sp. YR768]
MAFTDQEYRACAEHMVRSHGKKASERVTAMVQQMTAEKDWLGEKIWITIGNYVDRLLDTDSR